MWATVRPATKNNKLGRSKAARTILVEPDSQLFFSDANKYFKDEIHSVVECITKDITTKKSLEYEARWIAKKWFRYVISFILKTAAASLKFVNNHGKASNMSDAEIVLSISNLPENVYWQALCYGIHCGIRWLNQEKKVKYLSEMEEILSPYLDELGECSFEKLYDTSCTNPWNLKHCTISKKGIHVLFNWMKKVLVLALKKVDTRCSNDMGTIFRSDMIWAFNWIRLSQISSVSIFPLDVQEPNNACKEDMTDKRKMKNQKKILPYIPSHLVQSQILPKLPYDFLLRLKCVFKNWNEDIPSGNFQRLIQEQQANQQMKSFGIFGRTNLKKEVMKEHDGLELMFIETTSMMDMYKAEFCSSCNGLLCLFCHCVARPYFRYAVGNPITGDWNLILGSNHKRKEWICSRFNSAGLAVNSSNESLSYKLVVQGYKDKQNLFYIFSSETSEWKLSKAVLPQMNLYENSVYVNGVLYWKTYTDLLVWFDLDRDLVGLIDLS